MAGEHDTESPHSMEYDITNVAHQNQKNTKCSDDRKSHPAVLRTKMYALSVLHEYVVRVQTVLLYVQQAYVPWGSPLPTLKHV